MVWYFRYVYQIRKRCQGRRLHRACGDIPCHCDDREVPRREIQSSRTLRLPRYSRRLTKLYGSAVTVDICTREQKLLQYVLFVSILRVTLKYARKIINHLRNTSISKSGQYHPHFRLTPFSFASSGVIRTAFGLR